MASQQRDESTQKKTKKGRNPPKRTRRQAKGGRVAFARQTPRAKKRSAGTTPVSATPLRIYVAGADLSTDDKARFRELLGRRLWRFGGDITRAAVRFEDINGPRGGKDIVCRIKLSAVGLGEMVVEARDVAPEPAFRRASTMVKTAIERALDRRGRTASLVERPELDDEDRPPPPKRPPGGSFIGRRVGRTRENLLRASEKPTRGDAWVDTALPGTSATDRKAGGGSTAARNVRLRARRAAVTLEDSARPRPSRKSTRKSANRQKAGAQIARAKKRAHLTPKSRARRGRASK